MGLRRAIRPVEHDCRFNGAVERSAHRPWGMFGGGDGDPGRFCKIDTDGRGSVLPSKVNDVTVRAGECIVVETPGAGGYGPAAGRATEAIERDLRLGKFTPDFVRRHYPHHTLNK